LSASGGGARRRRVNLSAPTLETSLRSRRQGRSHFGHTPPLCDGLLTTHGLDTCGEAGVARSGDRPQPGISREAAKARGEGRRWEGPQRPDTGIQLAVATLRSLPLWSHSPVVRRSRALWQNPGVNNSGYYAATGLLRSWPEGGPKLAWKVSPGAGWCNVSVVDGKVYAVGGHTAVLSVYDLDGNLLSKGLAGSAIWKKWTGSRTTPIVHDGMAAVGMPNATYVGIDLATMESRWQLNAWKEFGSGKGAMGRGWPESPMRHGHKLIFNPCSRDKETPGVVAVDIRDGKKVWELPGRVPPDPTVKERYSAADVSGACFQHNGRARLQPPQLPNAFTVQLRAGRTHARLEAITARHANQSGHAR